MISIILIILLIATTQIEGACDYCQTSNFVACHSETVFSLCVDGIATLDYITCPSGTVCTENLLVCYAQADSVASCTRQDINPETGDNQCGVCDPSNQVFSCINETTIAFCFGDSPPSRGALAHCPKNSVCDLNNSVEFCSDSATVKASCSSGQSTTTTPTTTTPTTTTLTTTTPTTTTPTTTTLTTTTPTTTTPTTTPPITTTPTTITTTVITTPSPAEFCQDKGKGSFDDPYDPTCKYYYLCSSSISLRLTCADQFFNIAEGTCTASKPDYCI